MNLLKLSWKNLWYKPQSTLFTILIIAIGLAAILFISNLSNYLKKEFENNINGIDMVLGAKGSPLQLILSAVFQIDTPIGNIPLSAAEKISSNRWVKKTIPISFGDSYKGIRIVGTDTSYIYHYNGKLNHGKLWTNDMEVVLGEQVAKKLSLNVNDEFFSAHGLQTEGMAHDESPYKVVGILNTSQSVMDNLILTSTESIWHVHGGHEPTEPEITAMLVTFSSPMGLVRIPAAINKGTSMQAALPSFEINKLFSMLGIGFELFYSLGVVLLLVAATSLWINISLSLQDRSYELAFMRAQGASRIYTMISLLLESNV